MMKIISFAAALVFVEANTRFDPDKAESSECNIPPFQSVKDPSTYFAPVEGICSLGSSGAANATDDLEDAIWDELALEYAPVVYFHPLEPYTLSSVEDTFDDPSLGEILKNDDFLSVLNAELDTETLFSISRDPVRSLTHHKTFFRHKAPYSEDYKNGAGYDEDGRSRASVYYNIFDSGNGTVTFNYFFYYAWNGEANMAVLSSTNNTAQFTPFHLPPFGVHEGDWEAVSVIVCGASASENGAAATEPLAVSYRQHGWSQITDCTAGECTFYKDTNRAVGFAALHSHATYPVSTANLIYSTVKIPFYVNLQNVFVVDRTLYKDADGSYNYFFPNATSLKRIQDPAILEATDVDAWQAFGGRWGDSIPLRVAPGPPNCLNLEQTGFVDCPTRQEDPVFRFVMEFMGVYNSTGQGIVGALTSLTGNIGSYFAETGSGPTGPVAKNFYQDWLPPITSLFFAGWANDTDEAGFCENITGIPDTSRLPVEAKEVNVRGNLLGMIGFILFLMIANMVGITYVMIRYKEQPALLELDESGAIRQPTWRSSFRIFAPGALYSFAFAMAFIGAVLFLAAVRRYFSVLEDAIPEIEWGAVKSMLATLGIVVFILNVAQLIAIWFPQFELWYLINIEYFERTRNLPEKERYERKFWWNGGRARFAMYFLASLLFLSLMLSMLCVIVGTTFVGFSAAFREVCQTTLGAAGDVCLDLNNIFGIEGVRCGSDFVTFCNEFSNGNDVRAAWGALIYVVSEFYLIGSTAMALYQQKAELSALETFRSMADLQMKTGEPLNGSAVTSWNVMDAPVSSVGGVVETDNGKDKTTTMPDSLAEAASAEG